MEVVAMSKEKLKSIKPAGPARPGKKSELSESELAQVSGGDAATKGATTTTSSSGTPAESLSLNFTKIEIH
jgi:bacteriocin-like protein